MKLTITTLDDAACVVLPPELLARLRLRQGDVVYATAADDGIKLSPFDGEVAAQLSTAQHILEDDAELLRQLASA
jgi:hypothetical protein